MASRARSGTASEDEIFAKNGAGFLVITRS